MLIKKLYIALGVDKIKIPRVIKTDPKNIKANHHFTSNPGINQPASLGILIILRFIIFFIYSTQPEAFTFP